MHVTSAHFSAFHLLAEKTGDRLRKREFYVRARPAAVLADKQHTAHHIALGYDRCGDGHAEFLLAVGNRDTAAAVEAIGAAPLHDVLKSCGDALIHKLTLSPAGNCDHRVPVADCGDSVGGFVQAVAYLRCKVGQLADGGVFFENDLAVLVGVNLQRVALADAHCAADLLRNDDPAEIVPLCQERDKKINDFFKKPGAAWFLSFLKR